MSRAARTAVAVAAVVTVMGVPHDAAVTDARAATCISADRSFGCPHGRGMENPFSLALAPDGRTLYVPSDTEATAAVLRVNRRTGAVRQSAGRDGCLAGRRVSAPEGPFGVRYAASCTRVRGIAATVKALRVSPDGRHLYVISAPEEPPDSGISGPAPGLQAVAVLARRADGTYAQRAGRSGCVANQPRDGCAVRPTLRATDISISADGRHVYLAGSSTVTVMARDRRAGTLTWRSCLGTGKAAAECAPLPLGITYPGAPAFAPDGRTAYLDSATYSRARHRWTGLLLALTRDPRSGDLTARDERTGCLASAPFHACAVDARLDETVSAPVFSPDGRDAYTVTGPLLYDVPLNPDVPFAVTGFRHDTATGALAAADAPCLSRLDRAGCVRDRRVQQLFELAMAPDGTRLYATRGADVAAFARDPGSGALQLAAIARGCPVFGRCRADAPINNPTEIAVAPDGRHLFVASNDQYASGTVAVLATQPSGS